MKIKWLLLTLSLVFLVAGCQNDSEKATKAKAQTKTAATDNNVLDGHDKYDVDVKDRVALGEEDAKNTIVLAFDYSCPFCKQWFKEVLPQVEQTYIETGKVNFISQPLSVLNQDSLFMTKVDSFVQAKYPDKYYDIQKKFENRKSEAEADWASEEYVLATLKSFGIECTIDDIDEVANKGENPMTITRNYTQSLGVESVPTVYINGVKMNDPFDMDEMEQILYVGEN